MDSAQNQKNEQRQSERYSYVQALKRIEQSPLKSLLGFQHLGSKEKD